MEKEDPLLRNTRENFKNKLSTRLTNDDYILHFFQKTLVETYYILCLSIVRSACVQQCSNTVIASFAVVGGDEYDTHYVHNCVGPTQQRRRRVCNIKKPSRSRKLGR